MNADYTYDRETDQFVVTLDDGTEVCRTQAPHTTIDREIVAEITEAINRRQITWSPWGEWDLTGCPSRLAADIINHRITFYPVSQLV